MPRPASAPIEHRLEAALLEALRALPSAKLSAQERRWVASQAAGLAASRLQPGSPKRRRGAAPLLLQAPNFADQAEGQRWERELRRALRRSGGRGEAKHSLVYEDVFTELYAPQTSFALLLVFEPCLRFLARQDRLLPLDGLVPDAARRFHGLGLRRASEGGRLYGLPLFLSTRALFYRADLLAKHGLRPPRTMGEMEAAARHVTRAERDPALAGLALDAEPLNRFNLMLDLLWSQGAELFEGSGPWRFPAAAWRLALKRLRGWTQGPQALAPGSLAMDSAASAGAFAQGRAVFCLHWTDLIRRLSALPRGQRQRFGWCSHPSEEGAGRALTRLGGPSLVVPRASLHAAAGRRLVQALLSEEAQERLYAKGGWPFPAQPELWSRPALRRANPWLEEAEGFLAHGAVLEERGFLREHYLNWQNTVNAEVGQALEAPPGRQDLEASVQVLERKLSALLPARPHQGLVAQAAAIIESRAAQPLDVASLARELVVSREHLAREFKRQTGASPLGYVQKKQMEKAREILETTHYHVGEVAGMLGYQDIGNFSRLFKKLVGRSPGAFKRGAF